jgi:starch-binding outer membrane protein, SusD/RagB family
MKKNFLLLMVLMTSCLIMYSCRKSFLDSPSAGELNQITLANENGINALLIGAYSMLDGVSTVTGGWESSASNWLYGSIRGLEANKGSDAGDQDMNMDAIETFSENAANYWTMTYLNVKWKEVYEAISRCNSAIIVTNQALKQGTVTASQAGIFLKQARTLRGWFHFEAWRMWKMVPFVNEKPDSVFLSNKTDIRSKIIDDLTQGITLPDNMGAVGKFNGTVAKVLLAKALMQMNHDYAAALTLLQDAKNGTKPDGSPIGLAPTYGEIFDIANRNGIEAVYTVQYSVNDGSGGLNGGAGEVLNFPYKTGASPAGCCGYFQPTQEFVNSFRTSGGLPMLDYSYNNQPVKNDFGIPANQDVNPTTGLAFSDTGFVSDSGPLDPRLDWTVGRRGIPYWDWGLHTGRDWVRDQEYGGPYSPKKQVYKLSQQGKFTENGSWTGGFTANGYRMIRFADVLLMIAECQIETNDLAGALININLIRARAANPLGFAMKIDSSGKPTTTPAANYVISQYASLGTQDQARLALRMERKLELGEEGHRWFDLNRWGITVNELNRALNYEESMPWGRNIYAYAFVGPEDVTYPIPQVQIDLSNGTLVQNR